MSQQAPRLAEHVRDRGPLPADHAALLMLPVAESLGAAHHTSGAHGAVSPAAVLLPEGGGAILLKPGCVAADPAFTAPEVAAGARPDTRADVWSLAGVLLHATTGRTPSSGPVRPRDGGWLRPVIELALQPDPRDRPTMADVAAYLRAGVPEPGQEQPATRRASGVALTLVGVVVVALLATLGTALLLAGGADEDRATQVRSDPTSPVPRTDETSASESPPPSATPSTPTARDLEQFARTYVRTASADPDRGYARLTRAYQRASPRYHEVWSAIEAPEILDITGDPDTLTVRYTYRYTLPDGEQRTEDVTLRLVQRGGRLLIAGGSARPL